MKKIALLFAVIFAAVAIPAFAASSQDDGGYGCGRNYAYCGGRSAYCYGRNDASYCGGRRGGYRCGRGNYCTPEDSCGAPGCDY